jgi:hypothetical protein
VQGKGRNTQIHGMEKKRGVFNVKTLVLHAGSTGLQITTYETYNSTRFTVLQVGQTSPYYVLLTRWCSIETACRKVASK